MFYSQFILAKKGPLGTIWIAAHLERKLRKNQVADTDIGVSVDSILFPEMPIALRLSSHLLLGVVRIYSRKVNYLFDDCSEALLKVKQAFRSTAVDLPPEESTAPYHSITLPETFDLDDFELPDNEIFQGNYVDHHISSKDQITLQDTMEGVVYSTSKFGLDERFGDGDASGLDLDEELLVEKAATAELATGTSNSDVDPQASVQANASVKYDENQDAPSFPVVMPASGIVEEYDGDNEPIEYAQAPCTPGLWEEPNLSKIQETSAYDDHQEPENHSVTESTVKENLENAFSKEAECFPHEQQHDQFEQHEKSLPDVVATEQMLMDDLGSTPFTESLLADQARSMSANAEVSDTTIAVADDPVKVEDLVNIDARDEEPGVHTINDNHENCVELQGNQGNACHLASELESNTEPSGKDGLDNPHDQALLEPKDSTISVLSAHSGMASSDFPSVRPCATHLNHSETSDKKFSDSLQPSFTYLHSLETSGREEHTSASGDSILVQGEGPLATEALERKLQKIHPANLSPNDEVQVASNISNRQVENVIEGEVQVDNINSYTSDFPAPEKLLSLPQGLSDVPKDLLPDSTPAQEDIARGDGGDAGSNMLSGKKRSFTESSLTAQSLNLDESSGLLTTNITGKSVLGDDDLLSSILVGRRSSVLKMKPTPPVEVPSTKRRRSAPKTGISKRKALMDDNMVLHGDTIRQQLTNTEDIRRLRKKAPCTQSEISMIEKQFWEDELFIEAIFTGVSNELASLHNQSYDLSKIVVSRCEASLEGGTDLKSISQNDENGMQLEVATGNMDVSVGPNVPEENGGEDNFDPVARTDVSEAQPIEFPLVTDSHPCDNNTTNSDYYGSQAQIHATTDVAEPFTSDHELLGLRTAMEIDAKTFSDAGIGVSVVPIEVESLSHANVGPSDTCDTAALGEVRKTSEMDAFLQMDAPGVHSDGKMDLQSVDMDPFMDISSNKSLESSVASEIKVDVAPVGEISETKHELVANASATLSSETNSLRPHIVTLDQDVEIWKNQEEVVNEDAALAPDVEGNAQNLVSNGICGEEFETVAAYDAKVNPVLEDVSLDDGQNPWHQVTFPTTAMNVEEISANNRVDDDEFTYSAVGNDTDFLNFDDDDDEVEAAGDYMPESAATRFIDNSGWSSRTKAVAKYLQIMFDKEGERGRSVLPVNNLLTGKTRKEASRMFFETLVLKTKDYIHVEQRDPFENINILPRAKLLKSDF